MKDAESFAKSCFIKKCSEKFYKFYRKESLTNSFLSQVAGCEVTVKELYDSLTALNPIQDGNFRGSSRMGEGFKKAPPYNLPHISYNDET